MKCNKCYKECDTLIQVSHEVNGEVLLKLYCVNCLFVPVFKGVKPAVICDRMLTAANGRKFRNAEEMEEACWDEPDNVC